MLGLMPPLVTDTCTRFMLGEPMTPATKMLLGWSYMRRWSVALLQQTVREDGHLVTHWSSPPHESCVKDNDGDAQLPLPRGNFGACLHSQFGVEIR